MARSLASRPLSDSYLSNFIPFGSTPAVWLTGDARDPHHRHPSPFGDRSQADNMQVTSAATFPVTYPCDISLQVALVCP